MPRLDRGFTASEKQKKFDCQLSLRKSGSEIAELIMDAARNHEPGAIALAAAYSFGKPVNQKRKLNIPELQDVSLLDRPEAVSRMVLNGKLTIEDAKALNELTATSVEMGQLRLLQTFVDRVSSGEMPSQVASDMLPAMRGLADKEHLHNSSNVEPIKSPDLSFLE